MHIKVIKKWETKVEKTRKTLDQVEAVKLKKKNVRITIYKKLGK